MWWLVGGCYTLFFEYSDTSKYHIAGYFIYPLLSTFYAHSVENTPILPAIVGGCIQSEFMINQK